MSNLKWIKKGRGRIYEAHLSKSTLLEVSLDSRYEPHDLIPWEEQSMWIWQVSILDGEEVFWTESGQDSGISPLIEAQSFAEDYARTGLEGYLRELLVHAKEEVKCLSRSLRLMGKT